ncbi:MAG: hypothetical protein WA324_19670 [Bryobacteraceae bacterium]
MASRPGGRRHVPRSLDHSSSRSGADVSVDGVRPLGQKKGGLDPDGAGGFPRPGLLVTITGTLEILGAIGLFVPRTAFAASICLILLLIVIFPANIRAAREKLTIAGAAVPGLAARTALQIIFISALTCVAWLK